MPDSTRISLAPPAQALYYRIMSTPPTVLCQAKAIAGMAAGVFGGRPSFEATPGCDCQICTTITTAKEIHAAAPVFSPGMFNRENIGNLLTQFAGYQPTAKPAQLRPADHAARPTELRLQKDGTYR